MAKITTANSALVYAYPGESTMLMLKIYNNISKPITGIKAQFQLLGNDLGTDSGTVDCGYALGSKTAFEDISLSVAATKTVAAYLALPATITQYFGSGVRSVPLYLRCTLKYSDGSLFGFETVLENVSVLNYRYAPRIEDFELLRADDNGEETDEGEKLLTTLRLSLRDASQTDFMQLRLYYAEGAEATEDSPYIDLTSRIAQLLSGVSDDAKLISQTFSNGSNWNFLLAFGDEYEKVIANTDVSRAFANLHLSGKKTGGACFGGFSSSENGEPKLESYYPAYFYRGINGVTNYSLDEIATGGLWVDNKPIYKKTVMIPAVSAGSTKSNIASLDTGGIDTLIKYSGALCRNDGNLIYPLGFDTAGSTAYKADFYINKSEDGITVRTNSNTAISGGHVTIIYTKIADAPIDPNAGYTYLTDVEGSYFITSDGKNFMTEV